MTVKPDQELEIQVEKSIEMSNTVLGIVEVRPKELFNLNERTIAEGNDAFRVYNLIDDFEHIERQALQHDGERFHEVLRNVIRAINPIFSGDIGVAFTLESLESTQESRISSLDRHTTKQ